MDQRDSHHGSLDETPTLSMGVEIPGYRLIRQVGQGGMGVVFLAEQQAPVHRLVAIKLILHGTGDRALLARFERERQSLAQMNHPCVAQVFDAGRTNDGKPYFVMEYVDGEPITAYCDRRRAALDERIRLFRLLCAGVQHAHQRGILHRDLKPSNVLVTASDGAPAVKVIDFGLARALEPEGDADLHVTRFDQFVGTPAYMSPEQASPGARDADTRSDVYSLGVILFELLTGRLPHEDGAGEEGDPVELLRRIRQGAVIRPSALLAGDAASAAGAAARRATDPRALVRALRGDLDWIVVRAMELDRARRYASASELSADLERHLTHQPIVAGPPSTRYRAVKFIARHRVGVAAALLVATALVLAAVTSTIGLLRARRAEAAAREEASKATTMYEFLLGILNAPNPRTLGRDVKVVDALARAETVAAKTFAGQPVIEAGVRGMLAGTYRGLGFYEQALRQEQQAVEELEAAKGPESREALQGRIHAVEVLILLERFDEAIAEGRLLVDRCGAVLGATDSLTLSAGASLAEAYRRGGDLKRAEAMARAVVDLRRAGSPVAEAAYEKALSTLAMSVQDQGRRKEAQQLDRDLLDIAVRLDGPETPDTMNARNTLATALAEDGNLDEAEPLIAQNLEVQRRVLGPDHPDTIQSLMNLAAARFGRGRPGEAEALYREALAGSERSLPPGHVDFDLARSGIGQCLTAQGRCREAIPHLERARSGLEKHGGIHDPYTQDAVRGLAEAYEACGRMRDAARARALLDHTEGSGDAAGREGG